MSLSAARADGDRDRSHRRGSMGLHVSVSKGCLRISGPKPGEDPLLPGSFYFI